MFDPGSCYRVLGDIAVYSYSGTPPTLTLRAGVCLQFASGKGLSVGTDNGGFGEVTANGTAQNWIHLGPAPGVTDWKGIYFASNSDTYGSQSTLEYCTVTGAGGSWDGSTYANIYCNYTNQPTIRNCAITCAAQIGMKLAGSPILMETTRVDSCGTYPVYVGGSSWLDTGIGGCTYHANGEQAIALTGRTFNADTRLVDHGISYRILGDIVVWKSADRPLLSIDPGVRMEFASGTGLEIGTTTATYGGQLFAEGAPDAWIEFVPAPGVTDWKGLYFAAGSGYTGCSSTLRYCRIASAGGIWSGQTQIANLTSQSTTQPTLRRCAITGGLGAGVRLRTATVSMDSTRVDSCGTYPISVDANCWPNMDPDANTYQANQIQAIALDGRTLATDQILVDKGLPYRILGDFTVAKSSGVATLTVSEGVRLEFEPTAGLQIGATSSSSGGQLIASGTSERAIIFSRIPGGAAWKGLYFPIGSSYTGAASLLEYCSIQGAGATRNANVRCDNTAQPTMRDCIVLGATGDGVYLSYAPITLQRNLITGNTGNGIYTTQALVTIGGDPGYCNRLEGNGAYALKLGSNHNVNATYNWWGSNVESAIQAAIYDRSDSGSLGVVTYSPYSQEACGEWPLPAPFDLVSPANGIRVLTLTPSFDWEDTVGGEGIVYDLEIADNVNFQNAMLIPDLSMSQYDVTTPLPDGVQWYWRVKARNALGLWRYSAHTWTVITNVPPSVPERVYPADGAVFVPEWYMVWLKSTDQGGSPVTYQVQVDDDPAFASPEIDQLGVEGEQGGREDAVAIRLNSLVGVGSLVANLDYYWRVQAYDSYQDGSGFTSGLMWFHYLARAADVDGETTPKPETRLEPLQPNPARLNAQVTYVLSDPGTVRISIIDLGGREVRRLPEQSAVTGFNSATWDLCDERGARVPSGLYWVRMRAGAFEAVEKLLVIR